MMNKYKCIIFDLGNVIVSINFDNAFKQWAEALNEDFGTTKSKFFFDSFYEENEKGNITPEDYYNHVNSFFDDKLSYEVFTDGWNSIFEEPFTGIISLLKKLKTGHMLIILSNTNSVHVEFWKNKYNDLLKEFDFIFCSNELRCRKPDKMVFENVLDRIQFKPDEVLFFDDNEENVKGAADAGIKSFAVTSFEKMVKDLDISFSRCSR
jgi:glucose-1-phosphatase